MDHKLQFRLLKWDTDFFGFKVAEIIGSNIIAEEFKILFEVLKKNNVKLAYWATDPADNKSQLTAKIYNGFLADRKQTYILDDIQTYEGLNSFANHKVEPYKNNTVDEEIKNLAIQAGEYSRFNLDPVIDRKIFENLYATWVQKSVNKENAEEVLVVKKKRKFIGLITLIKKNKKGEIGLLAVDKNSRKNKIGKNLIQKSLIWFRDNGLEKVSVATQQSNKAACKLYESCGFRLLNTKIIYHFWLFL